MHGLGKKILPEEKRKVEIFLDQLAKPLQGAKRLLRQRGSEHLFPAYTHSHWAGTLCRSRNFQCAKEFLTPLGAPGGAL